MAVQRDGVALHGLQREVRGRSRQQEHVDVRPYCGRLLTQGPQLRLRRVQVGYAEMFARANDAAHRLDHRVLVRVKKFAYGGLAFRHQRAFIKQAGGLSQRLKVDCDRHATQGLHARGGLAKGLFGQHIAAKAQL